MIKKEYSLLSTEPLTDFDKFLLTALHKIEEHNGTPEAAIIAIVDKNGNVATCYHRASISDMILMRGYIDLDIQSEYQDANARPAEEDDGEEE